MNEQPQMPKFGNINVRQVATPAQPEYVIKWRMDMDEPIRKFEAMLRGQVYDPKTKRFIDPPNQEQFKICNEKGVAYARAYLTSLLNKNVIQGNISEDILRDQMVLHANTIIEHIGINYREYGIDKSMRKTYIYMLLGQVFLSLTRPINDQERIHAVQQGRETVHTSQTIHDIFPNFGQQIKPGLI